jgi:hypothetical protein
MQCTYCGSDLANYDPVFVEETRDGERVEAGAFCNYACLESHIDEAELTYGDACEWSPDE